MTDSTSPNGIVHLNGLENPEAGTSGFFYFWSFFFKKIVRGSDPNDPLAITVTGLTPASVVQLCWTHVKEKPPRCWRTRAAIDHPENGQPSKRYITFFWSTKQSESLFGVIFVLIFRENKKEWLWQRKRQQYHHRFQALTWLIFILEFLCHIGVWPHIAPLGKVRRNGCISAKKGRRNSFNSF